MATAVWKGHLTFGLVSLPVKLYRAARAEKVSFRQIHQATGARVRQSLYREPVHEPDEEPEVEAPRPRSARQLEPETLPFVASRPAEPVSARYPLVESEPRVEVSRGELAKGYEYEKDRFVLLTREELEKITPKTAREMEILEFVQLTEIDPIYFETSYYAAPDRGGERAYALLLETLRKSGYAALAQFAMQRREHIVIIRPGRTGIVLHTMFYESEIRRDDEYRTDTSKVSNRELDLALLLVRNLTASFDPMKYRDTYREKLEALIASKVAGEEIVESKPPKATSVLNILEALQRSLETTRKPPAMERPARERKRRTGQR